MRVGISGVAEAAKRVVFDTNVLLSLYMFEDSQYAALRDAIIQGCWQPLTNTACLDEYRRVLAYPQFRLAPERKEACYRNYVQQAIIIDSPGSPRFALPRCKDRDDQKFLEVARDGEAAFLITADKALLILARREKMAGRFAILSPTRALTEYAAVRPVG